MEMKKKYMNILMKTPPLKRGNSLYKLQLLYFTLIIKSKLVWIRTLQWAPR